MSQEARGSFTVQMTPKAPAEGEAPEISRMGLAKAYQGPLEGHSIGQMLAVRSSVEGSAGYVAMETFTGTLAGRRGSFQLQHSGIMDRGRPQLRVVVIPDSGTEELTGLAGTMDIEIVDGKHLYRLDYSVPESAPDGP